jgi:hypothetical protein
VVNGSGHVAVAEGIVAGVGIIAVAVAWGNVLVVVSGVIADLDVVKLAVAWDEVVVGSVAVGGGGHVAVAWGTLLW